MLKLCAFLFAFVSLKSELAVSGSVVLRGGDVSLSFEYREAEFAPLVEGPGKCGTSLHIAEPLDACFPLTNKAFPKLDDASYPFVLISRGGCSYEDKVRRAQAAGFRAAIVYGSKDSNLVAMTGSSSGIGIHAIFVSETSGETLKQYAGTADVELCINPSFENSVFLTVVEYFILTLAIASVIVTCFNLRGYHMRRKNLLLTASTQELIELSRISVNAMPTEIFTAAVGDYSTSLMCYMFRGLYCWRGASIPNMPPPFSFHLFR